MNPTFNHFNRFDGFNAFFAEPSTLARLLPASGGLAGRRDEPRTHALRQGLTIPDCFAAYVQLCSERGWTALTKNKFGAEIRDVIVRQFGVTTRNDIPDDLGKPERGWRGLALRENNPRPTDEKPSELSETAPSDETDTIFPVQPTK